ncbi:MULTISPECIES: DUF916 and DUF3324 domain-containing protein [Enterococcus]|uniref:DUF916 and DUF3324 domain-containing protein n=1 Tax=Enterococcus TaxID=1350 RepID=UPI000FF89D9E|nr:DUF916 and DUF3324 domain-containing protein [Enterococcus hirae]EMF0052909.1 DUF916 and DUF3324 domain-containing protein [Enterococcus hirae]EMF0094591.1 DUF916 and DUF3324 domain-containing protein [Enterococcus hirae]EMF0215928.1 DUF916 and DUF3324 domain-containing protein [Enterococcus hirae]EMF0504243.1 DUF916 and DUF3324 domain-containing protein [Enterococcus hirae]EMF0527321.1 DUF916 and DUF3324 domain-containing protein [Enterococcus hirae]
MKRAIGITILILSIFFCGGTIAYGEEGIGGFTIEGVPNAHQLDSSVGYFYLKENPEEKDEIKVKLINESSKEKTLEIKVTDANTNPNGIIDYTGMIKNHKLLKTPLTQIVKANQSEVKVPANSTKETTLTVTMPKDRFEGIVLGGIVVSEKKDEEKSKQTVSVENTYSYTLGVVLTNETENQMKKYISVELEDVGPILYDGRRIIQADILNPNPYIFPDSKVEGQIIDQKTKEVVRMKEQKNVSIAPFSVFPFQFDWVKEDLKPGKYLFKGVVTGDKKEWKFEKEFEITEEQADKINQESVFQIQIPKWVSIGSLVFALLAFMMIVFLLLRSRKRGK